MELRVVPRLRFKSRQGTQLMAPHAAVLGKAVKQQYRLARRRSGNVDREMKLANVPGLRSRFHGRRLRA